MRDALAGNDANTFDSHTLIDQDLIEIHAQGGDLWEGLRGARLFITGGTGFFGVWLLNSFAYVNAIEKLGATALVLSRDPAPFLNRVPGLARDPAIQFIKGDIRTFTFPPGSFTHVLHAALESLPAASADYPIRMLESALLGTHRVLEFAVARGARRLLFTSSGAVYGRQPPELSHVPEDFTGAPDPLDPRSAYGEAKRMIEQWCVAYHQRYGIEPLIARCFAFVGPFLPLDVNFAIGNFIRDAVAGGPISVSGDGTPFRSYLYGSDLALWLWTILLRGAPCRPYNVGSEHAVTIRDLACLVAEVIAPGMPVKVAVTPVPGKPAERYVPSTRRAESELGLRVTVGLREAIARTAASVSRFRST